MTALTQSLGLRIAAVALAMLGAVGPHVRAQAQTAAPPPGLSAIDASQVRTVVESQLAAFAKDDANKAFSYAAPNIRKTFGTAATFLDMVRRSYPVVYRPSAVAFLTPDGAGNQAVQRVQMQDAEGNAYLATYTLERQKNKTWRITGCLVSANKGQTA